MRKALIAWGAAAVMVAVPLAEAGQATSAERRVAALRIIREHVESVCQTPDVTGARTSVGGDAKIDAGVKGLTRLLVDVGGEVGARAEKVSWNGVAQEQLAQAIESGNACSVRMHELLVPMFLPDLTASIAPAAAAVTGPPERPPFGIVGILGGVEWFNGLYSTVERCLSALSTFSSSRECRRLPYDLVCSYASLDGAPPLPDCFWSPTECETNYELVVAVEQRRYDEWRKTYRPRLTREITPGTPPAPKRAKRARCDEVGWMDAVRQYRAWSDAIRDYKLN